MILYSLLESVQAEAMKYFAKALAWKEVLTTGRYCLVEPCGMDGRK